MPAIGSRHSQSSSRCSRPKRDTERLPSFRAFSGFATQPEIGMADDIPGLIEHLTTRQFHDLEIGLQRREVPGVERGQEPVRAMVHLHRLGHGDRKPSSRQRGSVRVVTVGWSGIRQTRQAGLRTKAARPRFLPLRVGPSSAP